MKAAGSGRGAGLAALLLVLLALLWLGARGDGLTTDEGIYIPAGLRHLARGDFSLNPETPPLAKLLCALPLQGRGLPAPARRRGESDADWARRILAGAADLGALIPAARLPVVVLTVLLAAGLWAWARATHGATAGWAALALAVFHPSLLAHGHLATTDLPATAGMLATSAAFWWWSRRPGLARAALVGLAFGLAISTRLTAAVLAPCLGLWALVECWRLPPAERRPRAGQLLGLALLSLLLGLGTVWASYGFRYSAAPDGRPARVVVLRDGAGGGHAWLLGSRLLPEAYLEGLRFQLEHERRGHPAYLLGERSRRGWRSYFLVAFLVKNTPGFLVATLLLLAALLRRPPAWQSVETQWLLPALATFAAASLGHIQIGERYLLPVYPYLILLIASRAAPLMARAQGRVLALAVAALHVAPAVAAAQPGHLAYFNALAGGTAGAHRVLLDSNLDWGQDLPRLARWMRDHGVDEVQLGYLGSDFPDRLGIRHRDLPGRHPCSAGPAVEPFAGVLVVSPNLLLNLLDRPGPNPYETLAGRQPDARAGVFFVYRLPAAGVSGSR